MSYPSAIRFRPVVGSIARLVFLLLPLVACRGEAQSNGSSAAARPKATKPIAEYRLTAPVIRKVSAIMREWNPIGGLGALMFGGDIGMPKEQFEALPDSAQSRIIGENMVEQTRGEGRAEADRGIAGRRPRGSATAAERVPALKAAMAKAGLSPNDFVAAFNAYNFAMNQVDMRELPDAAGPLQPGVRKDDVDLIRPLAKSEDLWSYLGG